MRKYLLSERSTLVINVCWLMSAAVIIKNKMGRFSWRSHDLMHERGEYERIRVVILGHPTTTAAKIIISRADEVKRLPGSYLK